MIGRLATVFACAMLGVGCAHTQYVTDVRHPEVAIDEVGRLTFRDRSVAMDDLPEALRDAGYERDDQVNIHVPDKMNDWRVTHEVIKTLRFNGFPRTVLVSDRKAFSAVGKLEDNVPKPSKRAQDTAH